MGSITINHSSGQFNLDEKFVEAFKNSMEDMQVLMAEYRCALMEIETKFKVLNEQFSLHHDRNPIETLKTRLKSPQSILEKLRKKQLEYTAENVEKELFDVAGVRVICPFIDDIYMLCECLLNQDDIRLVRMKDYIKSPKQNGYRSLHLIVEVPIFLQNEKKPMKVEVQLRTIAMDFWASVEHQLRYKKNLPEEVLNDLAFELRECANISSSLDYRMEVIKNRLDL
ncbi:MAG: GTP pyrophosphokinase family protein [Oscillospiraceae bacterium]|nr:GTP pyrophosphokinase family protein [Oscillospiraceae bacterium]